MEITVGMKGEVTTLVEREDTAKEVGSGSLLVYATPCMVALMEGAACEALTAALPEDAWGRRIMMIDNWNEWDEGHFVAPSHKFGFKFLQAIREVLTKRNNLPDYVMPQDAGFGGYNTSWRTPDFTGVPATEPEDEEL